MLIYLFYNNPIILLLLIALPSSLLIGAVYRSWKRGMVSGLSIIIVPILTSILLLLLMNIFISPFAQDGFAGLINVCVLISVILGIALPIIVFKVLDSKKQSHSSDEKSIGNLSEEILSKEKFSKLTYRQRFAITEYGYLLSPENAEVVGRMLGNFQDKDVFPFCQANGKKVSVEK